MFSNRTTITMVLSSSRIGITDANTILLQVQVKTLY